MSVSHAAAIQLEKPASQNAFDCMLSFQRFMRALIARSHSSLSNPMNFRRHKCDVTNTM
jgi:hypothetical protein